MECQSVSVKGPRFFFFSRHFPEQIQFPVEASLLFRCLTLNAKPQNTPSPLPSVKGLWANCIPAYHVDSRTHIHLDSKHLRQSAGVKSLRLEPFAYLQVLPGKKALSDRGNKGGKRGSLFGFFRHSHADTKGENKRYQSR